MTLFSEITASDAELPIDFSSPEDVLFEVICTNEAYMGDPIWADHEVEYATVIRSANDEVMGAASYENTYGGSLGYTIEQIADCPGRGWFVMEGVTGTYTRGDGWLTDDDLDFDGGKVRSATAEEVAQA